MNLDLSREWLECNGIGGYAGSTVIGCNTRRYHALLCAATRPPLGRMVLVNKADETLTLGGHQYQLGCNQYPGAIHPTGFTYLEEFTLDPLPRWVFALPGGSRLEKTLWMPHGENATVIRYTLSGAPSAQISLHPFITGRDYHGTHHYNTDFNTHCERAEGNDGCCHATMRPYEGCPPIVFSLHGQFYESGAWYYAFEYAIEQERGLDFQEDAYCPGAFVLHLEADTPAYVVVATQPRDVTAAAATHADEVERRTKLAGGVLTSPLGRLHLAADQFLVQRESDGLHTILAGYPWFSDWGRDTMIALPGLCLTTGRYDIARSILLAFARSASEGMIPNRFPDAGDTPEYNTVDATLWFFHATACYLERSGDWETIQQEIYPVLRDCIEWHLRGTRYGIAADPDDGLLRSGDAGTQLTWMDAKVGDWVVTPRSGKPVEIQALWYNALRSMLDFAGRAGDEATKATCGEWSRKVKANFSTAFWHEAAGCLYDCIDGADRHGEVRPNQILAVSLPHRLLSAEHEKRVVATVQRDLLTPCGLRSLSPHDPAYHGIYRGDQRARDGGYHQGAVWGWLIGPFLSAYLRVQHHSPVAKAQVREWLKPLIAHLDKACIGSISEIFDGDAPHTPRGCCAQAWSVSEVLRVLGDELN